MRALTSFARHADLVAIALCLAVALAGAAIG